MPALQVSEESRKIKQNKRKFTVSAWRFFLTCSNEWVIYKVMLLDFGVVGHDERKPRVHTGVPNKVPVLHTVRAD